MSRETNLALGEMFAALGRSLDTSGAQQILANAALQKQKHGYDLGSLAREAEVRDITSREAPAADIGAAIEETGSPMGRRRIGEAQGHVAYPGMTLGDLAKLTDQDIINVPQPVRSGPGVPGSYARPQPQIPGSFRTDVATARPSGNLTYDRLRRERGGALVTPGRGIGRAPYFGPESEKTAGAVRALEAPKERYVLETGRNVTGIEKEKIKAGARVSTSGGPRVKDLATAKQVEYVNLARAFPPKDRPPDYGERFNNAALLLAGENNPHIPEAAPLAALAASLRAQGRNPEALAAKVREWYAKTRTPEAQAKMGAAMPVIESMHAGIETKGWFTDRDEMPDPLLGM